MLWVLVMVCIPYAGMVLYLIFGSTTAIKLTSAFRRRRLSRRLPAAKAPENLLTDQQDSSYKSKLFPGSGDNLLCWPDYGIWSKSL